MLCQPWTHAQTMFCSPVNQDALSQVRIYPAAADPPVMFSEIQLRYFNTLPPLLKCLAEECLTGTQDTGRECPEPELWRETCRKKTKWQDKQSRDYGLNPSLTGWLLLAVQHWHAMTACTWENMNKVSYSFFCCLCIKMKTSMIYSWRLTHLHPICRDEKDKHFYG